MDERRFGAEVTEIPDEVRMRLSGDLNGRAALPAALDRLAVSRDLADEALVEAAAVGPFQSSPGG